MKTTNEKETVMIMKRSGFLMVVAAVSAALAGDSRRSGRHASLLVFWLGLGLAGLSMQAQNFGEWGPAQNMDPLRQGLNTPANDGCPIESPDGRTLFIATDRGADLDVWVASRDDEGGWKTPEPLPSPVNISPANDFCPTPLPGNALLFVSTRANKIGRAHV